MLNTYGNYTVIIGGGAAEIERAEEEMRQQAIQFLYGMGQPLDRMRDVEIIVKKHGVREGPGGEIPKVTVGWKVGVWQ